MGHYFVRMHDVILLFQGGHSALNIPYLSNKNNIQPYNVLPPTLADEP